MKKAVFKKAAIIVVVIAVGVLTVVAAKTTSRKKTVSDNIPQTRTESAYDFTNGESLPETVEKFVGNIKNALNIKKDNLKPNKGQKTAGKGENVYFDEEIGLAANEFKVIFKNYNGETLKTDIVKKGKAATPPKTPERKGYVFVGWDRTFNSIEFDVIVNAVFEKIKEPTIIADRVDCIPGQKKVGVNISLMNNLKNNPGIASLKLKVIYDSVLSLQSVVYNTAMGGQTIQPQTMNSPATIMWVSPFTEYISDTTFATLTFVVSEDVEIYYGSESVKKCNHQIETIQQNAPTCTQDGNREYWHCALCGKYFSDAAASAEITLPSTVLPATGHDVVIDYCPGFALVLTADNVDMKLLGNVSLSSAGENTVISKNVTLSKVNNSVTSLMELSGRYLVCGTVTNTQYLNVTPTTINEDEYNSYLTSSIITFNANGGSVSENSKIVYYGQYYGQLPTPTLTGFTFTGWYTESTGGTRVTSDSIVSALANQTLYAQWTANAYTVNWNTGTGYTISVNRISSPYANAATGALSNGSTVYYGDVLTITYTKADYYTINTTGATSITVTNNVTSSDIYATATQNDVSDWVLKSDMPSGGKIVETKWDYTLREYTSSSSSSLSGWTHYQTTRTGWGGWSAWSTTNPSNGVRNVESRTEYHYYRWINGAYVYTYNPGGYTLQEKWTTYELPRSSLNDFYEMRYEGTDTYANRWIMASYAGNNSVSKTYTRTTYRYQDPVYTYYFYRDLAKSTTDGNPTGQSNVSNVKEYVKYIPQ